MKYKQLYEEEKSFKEKMFQKNVSLMAENTRLMLRQDLIEDVKRKWFANGYLLGLAVFVTGLMLGSIIIRIMEIIGG